MLPNTLREIAKLYRDRTDVLDETMQSCPRRRTSLATNGRRGGQLGAHWQFIS
jgi:hypothetical protein